jgi:CelD/BcsL family acetyltransferase involved in cellulose biosynthesis
MVATDDAISVRVISDTEGILQIERQWNALVGASCSNAFLLSEFAKEFIEYVPRGWTPLVLTISKNDVLIGIVPLKTKRNIVGRRVDFLYPQWCSEFIFDEQHRNECINLTFDFLFKTLNCKFVNFTLPDNSPHSLLLKQECKLRKIHLETSPEMSHWIIPINSTWTEFEKLRSKKFERKINRTERHLNKMGSWKTICIHGNDQPSIVKTILNIEEKSWKEKGLGQKEERDWILLLVLRSAQQLAKIEPDFKWNAWLLELEGKMISYQLSIEFKGVVYFVKTSYDEQYKRLYPGIAIQNAAIKEQFTRQENKYIDFLSDFPYFQTWTDECLSRVRVELTKGVTPTIIQLFIKNKLITRILSNVYGNANEN